MRRWLTSLCILYSLGALSACSQEKAGPPATPTEALNSAIACLNTTANPVVDSSNAYLPTQVSLGNSQCENATILRLPKEALPLCVAATQKTLSAGDETKDLHGHTKSLEASYQTLQKTLVKAHLYYLSDDHLEDNCVNGAMLNTELQRQFKEYFAHEKALRNAIQSARKDDSAAFLEEVRQRSSEGMEWHIRRILSAAKILVRDGEPTRDTRLAAYNSLENATAALESYLGNNENSLTTAKADAWWDHTKILLAKSKAWARAIRAGEDRDTGALVLSYNAMLAQTNTLSL